MAWLQAFDEVDHSGKPEDRSGEAAFDFLSCEAQVSTDLKVVPRAKPVQDKNVPFRLRQPEQGVLDRAGLIRAVK